MGVRQPGRRRGAASAGLLPVLLALGALLLTGCGVRALPVDPSALGGLAQTSTVVAADGTVLAELHGAQDRRPLPLEAVPPLLVAAVLAAEDERFYDHDGVDLRGIARAAAVDVATGSTRQGGSTITQQLVKNTLVSPEQTLQRKAREAALAIGLEDSLTKDQILERYLDTVYFGGGAYGAGAALRTWFGLDPQPGAPPVEVTPGQAALLAGLIRSPSAADPIENPDLARTRRSTVLQQMVGTGTLTEEQAAQAEQEPLPTALHGDGGRWSAPYAVADAVASLLDDPRLGPTRDARRDLIFRGGVTVRLTVEPRHQAAAERAVEEVLNAPGDPDAAAVSVRPGTGAITALVGGRDFYGGGSVDKVNLATGGSTGRQAGSTFKVFALLAALEAGLGPDTMLPGPAQQSFPRQTGPTWEVDNYEGTGYGELTLRSATENSVNTAYAELVRRLGDGDVDAGTERVVEMAERLGVRTVDGGPLRREPAVVLGAQEVTPVGLAGAYAAIAAGGTWVEPHLVAEVRAADGTVLLTADPRREDAVAPGVAAVATDVLQGVLQRGTGVRARLARPAAGKTGTTQEHRDAWFAGYTPTLATTVWMGRADVPTPMLPENGFRTVVAGGTFPAEVWRRTVEQSLLGEPSPDFPLADGAAVTVPVDRLHDCRPNEHTPERWIEERTFLAGQEPTEVCTVPTGPPPSAVPDLLARPADDAQQRLEQSGFEVHRVEVPDLTYPGGTVVGQEPAAGSPATPGGVVVLQVAASGAVPVTVPDVLGLPRHVAEAALRGAGLRPVVVEEPTCRGGGTCPTSLTATAGLVWRQDVAAGASATSGDAVGLAVGPPTG